MEHAVKIATRKDSIAYSTPMMMYCVYFLSELTTHLGPFPHPKQQSSREPSFLSLTRPGNVPSCPPFTISSGPEGVAAICVEFVCIVFMWFHVCVCVQGFLRKVFEICVIHVYNKPTPHCLSRFIYIIMIKLFGVLRGALEFNGLHWMNYSRIPHAVRFVAQSHQPFQTHLLTLNCVIGNPC